MAKSPATKSPAPATSPAPEAPALTLSTAAAAPAGAAGSVAAIVSVAVQAVKASDSAFHSAAIGMAFLACVGQTFELRGGRKLNPAKFGEAWDTFLKQYLAAGHVAYTRPMMDAAGLPVLNAKGKPRREGCVEEANAIRLARSAEKRNKLVNDIWNEDTRPAGYHLAKGLTRIKLAAKAILGDVILNNAGWVKDIQMAMDSGLEMKDAKAAAYIQFSQRCANRYGSDGASLEAFLQGGGAGAGAFDAAKWSSAIVKRVDKGMGEVPTDVLAALIAELQNRLDARTALASTAEALNELEQGAAVAPAEQIPEEAEGEDMALAA